MLFMYPCTTAKLLLKKKNNFKLAVNHLMSLPKSPILLNGIPFEKVELFKHLGLVIPQIFPDPTT